MLPDKCQPLLTGKQHCQVKCSSIRLPASLGHLKMMCLSFPHTFLCLSLSRGQTLFYYCCCHPSLSPGSLSSSLLSLRLLVVLNLFVALRLLLGSSSPHSALFSHLLFNLFVFSVALVFFSNAPFACYCFNHTDEHEFNESASWRAESLLSSWHLRKCEFGISFSRCLRWNNQKTLVMFCGGPVQSRILRLWLDTVRISVIGESWSKSSRCTLQPPQHTPSDTAQ